MERRNFITTAICGLFAIFTPWKPRPRPQPKLWKIEIDFVFEGYEDPIGFFEVFFLEANDITEVENLLDRLRYSHPYEELWGSEAYFDLDITIVPYEPKIYRDTDELMTDIFYSLGNCDDPEQALAALKTDGDLDNVQHLLS